MAATPQPVRPRTEVKEQSSLTPAFVNIGPLQTRPVRTIPGLETLDGFRLGHVVLRPAFDVDLTYDDNIFGASKGSLKHDKILHLSPGLSMDFTPSESFSVNASYNFGWHDYLDDTARDFLTHDESFSLKWKSVGVQGLDLTLAQQYSQTGNTAVLEDEFLSFTRVQGNHVGPVLNFQHGRLGLSAAYAFGFADYFGRTTSEGDYHDHVARGLFFYQLSERMVPYVSYEFTATRFAHLSQGDFDFQDLRAGLRWSAGRFKFDFNLGNRRSIVREGYDSNDGPAASLRVDYSPNERWNLTFNASRIFDTGVRTGSATNTELSAGAGVQLLQRLRLDTLLLWLQSDRASGTLQRTMEFDFRLTGRLVRHLTGFLSYTRLERTSNGSNEVIINRLQAGLQARF